MHPVYSQRPPRRPTAWLPGGASYCRAPGGILHGGRHAPGIGHGMDHPPSRPIIGLGRLFPRLHQLPGQFQKWLMVLRQPDPLCQPILLLRVQMPVSVPGGLDFLRPNPLQVGREASLLRGANQQMPRKSQIQIP